MNNDIFLNFNKILSFGSLVTIVIAERGVGKTFGAKDFIVSHFKSKSKQSVYVRRYNRELQESLMKKGTPIFFDQIKKKYPNDELVDGSIEVLRDEICKMFGGTIYNDED